ncbi:MAG: hypothetical protein MUQ10_13005 [Anaerolineae bacterium]|nr:hypothetical protein [Anaerolineae bacterium]
MKKEISSRVLVIVAICVAVGGLALLLKVLSPKQNAPELTVVQTPAEHTVIPSTVPSEAPAEDFTVASVDDRAITFSQWETAVLIDHVLSDMAGQAALSAEDTLQRLINEEMVISGAPTEYSATTIAVEAKIAELENAWSVEDADVVAALSSAGLSRAVFEETAARLLSIEASTAKLAGDGVDLATWLEETRAMVDISTVDNMTELAGAISTDGEPGLASAPPTAIPLPSSTPSDAAAEPVVTAAPTWTPWPTPVIDLPETVPDFTLHGANMIVFTLSEQLDKGPVVLQFFRMGG